VVVVDNLGDDDAVHYYVGPGTTGGASAQIMRRISAAAVASGLSDRGVEDTTEEDEEEEGYRVLTLETTLGAPAGFLTRRIEGSLLEALDVFGTQLVVDLPSPTEVVRGTVTPLPSDSSGRQFRVEGHSTVVYRVPPPSWAGRFFS
jgi:hypothetical protein